MRKQFKSIVSMVLSAAMVVALGSGLQINTKSAAAFGYDLSDEEQVTLYLRQNNSKVFETDPDDESGTLVELPVTQTGIYTLTAEAVDDIEDVAGNYDVKYIGVELGVASIPESLTFQTRMITVKHFEKDGSATVANYDWNATLYHNALKEDTGELRFGVVNNYVPESKADEFALANPFTTNVNGTWTPTDAIDVQQGDLVSFTLEVHTSNEPANWEEEHPYQYTTPEALIGQEAEKRTPTPKTPAPPTPTPNMNATSYNAYIGFQTDNYLYRDPWNKTDSNKYYNHKTQICIAEGGKGRAIDAKITNAEIKENTTYTISISGANMATLKCNDANAKTATQFNMLYVDTDIPLAMKGVSAVNASLKIDGKVVKTGMTLPCKPDADGYYQLMVADAYSEDDGIKNVPYPKENALKTLPTSDIEITFTMKGINFKQDFSTKTIGPKKGKTFTKGNLKYKVTKAATETAGKKKAGKVTVVGLSAKGKKAKSLSVPASVKNTGSYKVTALGKNAFKGAKATKITLGKTIKKIPANAFANCKKLKTLKLNAKLSSVNKKAFKGCKKAIKVSGKSAKVNLKKIKKVYKKAK